jgi:uncharacterized protein (DUF362 family)
VSLLKLTRARTAVFTALVAGLLAASCRDKPVASKAGAASASASASTPAASSPLPSASADTVSQASPAYDAGPPVIASGKVDGAELRKRHIERLKADRSPVTVLGGGTALELGERICEAVVPKRPATTPILIKPNICGFDGIKDPARSGGDDGVKGRVTEPEFVRGVLRCLKKRGHTQVTLAEGCGNSLDHWKRTIAISGFEAMAKEEQVPLVAMDDDGKYDVEGDQPGKPLAISGIEKTHVPTLLMPKILAETLEHGLFISVPKLKAHRYSVVSLGIKGMQGTVMRSDASPAYNQKWRMHAELKDYLKGKKAGQEDRAQYVASLELFAERMVDVLEISLPDVVLVDGAPAVAGDGFQTLRAVAENVALGGTNPVLVDRVGAEYLGLWNNAALARELGGHKTSPLIEVAARRYGVDLKSPTLVGDGADAISRPRPVFFKALAPFSIDGNQVISAAPPKVRPTARAARAVAAPKIDGVVEAAWASAAKVTWNTDYAGSATSTSTSARFLWSEAALFALFELEGAGVNVDRAFSAKTERPRLYQEDCVELFLTPNPEQPKHYFEIELGPLGHFFDLEVDRAQGKEQVEWSSGLEIATHVSDATGAPDAGENALRRVTIEARFAAPEIVAALKSGARLPLGLFRMEGKAPRQYLAWSPPRTPKPNFHVPEAFGTLELE